MNDVLKFNNKIINLFDTLDGRDKVFKFVQYYSKFLYFCIEKKYYDRFINHGLIKHSVSGKSIASIVNRLSRKTQYNETKVIERLKSLEDSLCDARIVFRLFGFFREFNNLYEFSKSLLSTLLPTFKSIKSINIKSFNSINIKSTFSSILELIDHLFNFISEINDIIFWGTHIKIFRFPFIGAVAKISDFVWIYCLVVFLIRTLYSLLSTIIQIYKLKKQLSSSNSAVEKQSERDEIKEKLVTLNSNKINEVKSLISAISEFGLCICSIYEIENDGIVGLCGSVSAYISLQEIWKDITENSESNSNINAEDNNGGEGVKQALICPPIIHIHSNPN